MLEYSWRLDMHQLFVRHFLSCLQVAAQVGLADEGKGRKHRKKKQEHGTAALGHQEEPKTDQEEEQRSPKETRITRHKQQHKLEAPSPSVTGAKMHLHACCCIIQLTAIKLSVFLVPARCQSWHHHTHTLPLVYV